MEVKREVRIFEVTYQCPKCNNGELVFSHHAKLTSPLQNLHTCTNCNHQEWIRGKVYPTKEYVYVENEN